MRTFDKIEVSVKISSYKEGEVFALKDILQKHDLENLKKLFGMSCEDAVSKTAKNLFETLILKGGGEKEK